MHTYIHKLCNSIYIATCVYICCNSYKYCAIIFITLTDFMVFPSFIFEPDRHTVGQEQALLCTATVISTSEHSVIFSWITPDGVDIDDERVTILPTTIDGNNFTSILKFEYLMENDNGTYICDIMSNNNTISTSEELDYIFSKQFGYMYGIASYMLKMSCQNYIITLLIP